MLKIFNLKIIKKLFFYSSLCYVFYALTKNFGQLSIVFEWSNYKINLILAFTFCVSSIVLNALAWKQIIIWFGHNKNSQKIIEIFIATNILKYVPGSVWHFVERFNFLKQKSSEDLAFYATLIEPYFMLSAALLMCSFGAIYFPALILFSIPAFFLRSDLIYLTIKKLDSFKNNSIRLFNIPFSKKEFESSIKFKKGFPLDAFILEIVFLSFKFFGFISCFYIFNSFAPKELVLVFVTFCLSWSVGLITPAAPGGVGVFESCFLLIMRNYYYEDGILSALIFFRLISTSSDLFLATPFFLKKFSRSD